MSAALLVPVLLIAPVFTLMGVCAGACLAYRLCHGQPPLPPLPRLFPLKLQPPPTPPKEERVHPPAVQA